MAMTAPMAAITSPIGPREMIHAAAILAALTVAWTPISTQPATVRAAADANASANLPTPAARSVSPACSEIGPPSRSPCMIAATPWLVSWRPVSVLPRAVDDRTSALAPAPTRLNDASVVVAVCFAEAPTRSNVRSSCLESPANVRVTWFLLATGDLEPRRAGDLHEGVGHHFDELARRP